MDKYSITSWGKFVDNLTVDNFDDHLMNDSIGKSQHIFPEFLLQCLCYSLIKLTRVGILWISSKKCSKNVDN